MDNEDNADVNEADNAMPTTIPVLIGITQIITMTTLKAIAGKIGIPNKLQTRIATQGSTGYQVD